MKSATEKYKIYISVAETITADMLNEHLETVSAETGLFPILYYHLRNGYVLVFVRQGMPFYLYQNKILEYVAKIKTGVATMTKEQVTVNMDTLKRPITSYAKSMQEKNGSASLLKCQQEDFAVTPKIERRGKKKKKISPIPVVAIKADNYLIEGQLMLDFNAMFNKEDESILFTM